MKNMKVSRKLILGFSIVAFVSLIVGCIGVVGLLTLRKSEDKLYREGVEGLTGVNGMYCVIVEQRLELRGMMINIDDDEAANKNVELLRAREEEFEELYQLYLSTSSGTDAKENALIERAMGIYSGRFKALKEQMTEALAAGEKETVREAFSQVAIVAEEATQNLHEMVLYANERADAMNEQDNRTAFMLIGVSVSLTVLLVALSVILGVYISGIISKPLVPLTGFMKRAGAEGDISLRQEDIETIEKYSRQKDEIGEVINSASNFVKRMLDVGGVLEKISDGDLTSELDLLSDNDTMGMSLQKMTSNLNDMFMEINASTEQVTFGSKQIADGAQSLAQGSTEQASSIEELSASISEIAEQTKQNAGIAKEAAILSGAIRSNAEKGNGQMDQMMQAVKEINEASNQIGKVIKVIDDIAFQTNILALNAAVEAARAGQHGKGFAVVAEEVRNLAAKSAEAAKDTGGLIENSIEKANLGMSIATETAESLKEIVEGINRSAEIVNQIALSSNEQAGAIAQINVGIDQVAQVVQQNSATAEESAAASEEMSGQSDMLTQLISRFKLKDTKYNPPSPSPSEPQGKIITMPGRTAFALIGNQKDGFGKY